MTEKHQHPQRSQLHGFREEFSRQPYIMAAEELAQYRDFCKQCHAHWQPQGFDEEQLVSTIANTQWALNCSQAAANNIIAVGYTENLDRYQTQDAETHTALVTAHSVRDITVELGRLTLITQRFARQIREDRKELRAVQAERKAHEKLELDTAVQVRRMKLEKKQLWNPADDGLPQTVEQIDKVIRQRDLRAEASRFAHPQRAAAA